MEIEQALEGLSMPKYFKRCGYSYNSIKNTSQGNTPFRELPPRMQLGILNLINDIRKVEKMVYSYHIDVISHYLKLNGIKLQYFYNSCGLKPHFYRNPSWKSRNKYPSFTEEEGLIAIRLQLMKLNNRLFKYVMEQ